MVTGARLTLDEFLALPETEPASEFTSGRVFLKAGGEPAHALLVARTGALLADASERTGLAFVMVNARYANRREDRAFLPDISIVLREHMPTDRTTLVRGPLEFPPDIAIEVLSPDDRPSRVSNKVSFYLRSGTEIVWLIDAEERTLTEHRRGDLSRIFTESEAVSAAPVLANFSLDLARLFAVLPQSG